MSYKLSNIMWETLQTSQLFAHLYLCRRAGPNWLKIYEGTHGWLLVILGADVDCKIKFSENFHWLIDSTHIDFRISRIQIFF